MRTLVVGDTILDKYVFGTVDRVNPEAPGAVVLDYRDEEERLGGAANVAANIRSLCKIPELQIDYFGFASSKIIKMLEAFSISCVGVSCSESDLLTKTRFVVGNQHLLRLDRKRSYDEELIFVSEKLIKGLRLFDYDLVVISDYAKGSFSEEIAYHILTSPIPTVIDLKKSRKWMTNVGLGNCFIKCNNKEFEEGNIYQLQFSSPRGLVVTYGHKGYKIIESPGEEESYNALTIAGNVDVVGAGDTFLAAMAANFFDENKSFDIRKMSSYGNRAAGEKVKHFGTKHISWKDL